MHKITREEHTNLTTELEETIKGIFTRDFSEITDEEQQRLDEIADILKQCEVVD